MKTEQYAVEIKRESVNLYLAGLSFAVDVIDRYVTLLDANDAVAHQQGRRLAAMDLRTAISGAAKAMLEASEAELAAETSKQEETP